MARFERARACSGVTTGIHKPCRSCSLMCHLSRTLSPFMSSSAMQSFQAEESSLAQTVTTLDARCVSSVSGVGLETLCI